MVLQIFDPPMCCSTGTCGPEVDPELVRFAADVEWLRREGVEVERYNLSQEPGDFMASAVVRKALEQEGVGCLPLVLIDSVVVHRARYPSRRELVAGLGLAGARREEK